LQSARPCRHPGTEPTAAGYPACLSPPISGAGLPGGAASAGRPAGPSDHTARANREARNIPLCAATIIQRPLLQDRPNGGSWPVRLVAGAPAGLILLMLGVLAGVYAGTSQRADNTVNLPVHFAPDQQHVRILVATPSPACGLMVQDGFRSPATTAFSNATQVISVSLDGISAAVIQEDYLKVLS